jgi:hypothetical protein
MTPTDEIAALRCVVEAARNWRRLRVDGTGKEWVSAVDRLVAALDALPAASPARETLATALIAAGLPLREIAEERIGLEDIFIAATRRAPADLRRP